MEQRYVGEEQALTEADWVHAIGRGRLDWRGRGRAVRTTTDCIAILPFPSLFPLPRGPAPLLDHVSQASFSRAQILFVGLLQTVYADVRQIWGRIN